MFLKLLTSPFKIKSLEIHPWTVLLFLISLYFRFFHILAVAYAITAIHELAHIFTAKKRGIKISAVEILPFGITARLERKGIRSTSDEIIISLAGPFSNLLIAYFTYGFYSGALRDYIITSSIAMGIFNLLPALPLDGGRIMRSMLVKKYGHIRATSVAVKFTHFTAMVILLAGLYLLFITGFNFSFLIIGGFLIANMTEERKHAHMIIMKDILYSRKKLEGAGEAKILVANENENAKNILNRLSYDRYYIIKITDSTMNIIATITETQLIEAMAIYGMNITMKKIVGI